MGYTLAGAYEDANDAVAKIRKHRPDVVLMDIQMPGLSGIRATETHQSRLSRNESADSHHF